MHSRTAERWFEIDVGTVKLGNGLPVFSPEHTSVFPHATDACTVCCEYALEEKAYQATLKRHGQQSDQGSISRINDTAVTECALEDLQAEKKRHREEAAAAMEFTRAVSTRLPANTPPGRRFSSSSLHLTMPPLRVLLNLQTLLPLVVMIVL